MSSPTTPMLALRCLATVQLALVLGQVGTALGGGRGHATLAPLTLAAAVASALAYVLLRRRCGMVVLWLALTTLVATTAQYGLGQMGAARAHTLLGVLLLALTAGLAGATYRQVDRVAAGLTGRAR